MTLPYRMGIVKQLFIIPMGHFQYSIQMRSAQVNIV